MKKISYMSNNNFVRKILFERINKYIIDIEPSMIGYGIFFEKHFFKLSKFNQQGSLYYIFYEHLTGHNGARYILWSDLSITELNKICYMLKNKMYFFKDIAGNVVE